IVAGVSDKQLVVSVDGNADGGLKLPLACPRLAKGRNKSRRSDDVDSVSSVGHRLDSQGKTSQRERLKRGATERKESKHEVCCDQSTQRMELPMRFILLARHCQK